ncbi:PP2C family protein-serine/threonine phosphatase [Maridesulfovibrio sp.]|uniref:PP2C family protein-serine/threonine phosphatase n=1 Tax=Maridesulfovibrio sp. TaxID=2795000 RepID=UPI003B00DBAA
MIDIKVKYIADSLKGVERDSNKDGYFVTKVANGYFFVVLDGVSSSNEAKQGVNMVIRFIKKNAENHVHNDLFDVKSLIMEANKSLLNSSYVHPYTTFCAAYIYGTAMQNVELYNVGDSRVYAVSSQYVDALTEDDSLGDGSNVITKCLGMDDLSFEDVHHQSFYGFTDDLLLCTDGFYSVMSTYLADFFKTFTFKNIDRIKNKTRLLIDGKNRDDATYVLVRVGDV